MANATITIRHIGDDYVVDTKLADFEAISIIGKAQRVLLGENIHGKIYPPNEAWPVTLAVELYYEIRESGESKVTIFSRESQYMTMQILKNTVAMLVTKLYSK